MSDASIDWSHLTRRAREGDQGALGELLDIYRSYLQLLIRAQLDGALQVRIDASDVVQESLLEAYRDFQEFDGETEAEFVAWLRRIVIHNLIDQARRHRASQRDVARGQSLEAMLERSSEQIHSALGTSLTSPSAKAIGRESAVLLADAMASLPPDYQEAIILRHIHRLRFPEIGARMERSPAAARMLWVRGLESLQRAMQGMS